MLRNSHYTPHFGDTYRALRTGPPVRLSVASPRVLIAALRTMWEACRDGLAAQRQYEHLRSRGVAHEEAMRESLGVGHSAGAHERAKPLWFAGKA